MNFSEYFANHKLTPRPQQLEILDKLGPLWEKYKYIAISAPTGVGKTYVAIAIADSLPKSYLLTGTKDLQAQYERSSAKIVDLKGRSNYTCRINPIFMVDEAPCLANKELKTSCVRANVCDYYTQKAKALKSQMMITNYAYFLTVTANADEDTDWVPRDAVIMDEAHDLEKQLISMAELRLNLNDLYSNFGVGDDEWRFTDNTLENHQLLELVMKQMEFKIEEMDQKIEELFNEGTFMQNGGAKKIPKSIQEKVRKINSKKNVLSNFVSKILIFMETKDFKDSPWIETPNLEENSIILAPLTAKYLFKHYMEDFGDKFVFMSATMPPPDVLCKELGIARDEMLFIEVGTPFDAEKSPIVALPIAKMNYKEIDRSIPIIIGAVEAIMADHPKEKGLIHTGNYKVAKAILDGVNRETRSRLIARDMGSGLNKVHNQDLLKLHYSSDDPTVLVSPSMTTGIDLYDDMARFQIIVKLPFLSLADARIKKKAEMFPDWYLMQMWVEVMQASGRATRNEDDYSTTYILDASFEYFYDKAKKSLPGWFKERLQF